MINVVIIGFGNVGNHLYTACKQATGVSVVQVINRSPISKVLSVPCTSEMNSLEKADIYLIAVPDNHIAAVSEQVSSADRLVAHTSGSVSISAIHKNHRKGVFYPLQTFSKNRAVDFSEIPICIEAESAKDEKLLKALGESLSQNVVTMTSGKREKLHMAAVWVNNFVNHLFSISEAYLKNEGLAFKLLHPLIDETVQKMLELSPLEAQTGPALRQDTETIKRHLQLLENESMHQELYQLISNSIQSTHLRHGEKL